MRKINKKGRNSGKSAKTKKNAFVAHSGHVLDSKKRRIKKRVNSFNYCLFDMMYFGEEVNVVFQVRIKGRETGRNTNYRYKDA